LGQIPIVSDDTPNFKKYYECTCENGCDNCNIRYELFVSVGDNELQNNDECKLVTVENIRLVNENIKPENAHILPYIHKTIQDDNNYDIKNDQQDNKGIVIMKLKNKHVLHAKCIARKSIGKDHAKFNPTVACSFKYIPKIKLIEDRIKRLNKSEKQSFVNSCPTNVFQFKEHYQSIELINPNNCT